MRVKMRFDGLIFVGLSLEQIDDVTFHADKCELLLDESGGVQVRGKQADLFTLLYNLSVVYDIEIL